MLFIKCFNWQDNKASHQCHSVARMSSNDQEINIVIAQWLLHHARCLTWSINHSTKFIMHALSLNKKNIELEVQKVSD